LGKKNFEGVAEKKFVVGRGEGKKKKRDIKPKCKKKFLLVAESDVLVFKKKTELGRRKQQFLRGFCVCV